ncbi:MAG: PHB depolymerase family esterase [Rhizomicrobium sp.]
MKTGAVFLLAILLAPAALAQDAPAIESVTFAETTPLAGNAELSRRLLSPLTVAQMRVALARASQSLRDQPITVANEKFLVHVPPQMPASGYAALIFVPAAKATAMPKGWQSVLDSHGVIFVSAQDSGNNSYDMSRRMPLAVLAAVNTLHHYKVDPARVFVGGMSGGSRVAMRLALGYPDLFAGGLLNAGSDPLDGKLAVVPPRELFQRFQDHSRLVYLTGEADTVNLNIDAHSASSMRSHCMFNLERRTMPRLGHETADPASLAWGLETLLAPVTPDPQKLAGCRADAGKEAAAALDAVEALKARGRQDEARTRLYETDARFGGLAAPRSESLNSDLGPPT